MIELQVLNRVLKTKSLALLKNNGITVDYFVTYSNEARFIYEHYEKYGVVPDVETFLDKFPDFDLFEVRETDQYLIETLKEQHLYNEMVPFINRMNDLVTEDSQKAMDYAKKKLEYLSTLIVSFIPGHDIIKGAVERGNEYKKRLEIKGLLGITTGIPEFDEVTHGWLPGEDFIVIVGRTNEGKTWVLLFFLVAAWKSGKRVLLYSGEMPKDIVGFRFDTLNEHFSHSALMSGSPDLGDSRKPEDYIEYVNNISKDPNLPPFIVVTPKDLGGKRLDAPTLEMLIEQYKPDIVGIDQLSLMSDYRAERGQPERIRYTHIAEDLYAISEKYGIPILSPSQANRETAKKSDDEAAPELHEISESDGVGQNATRVISMRQLGSTLKLSIKKNRYGKKNYELLLLWDIDKGLIKPFMQVQKDKNDKVTSAQPISEMSGEELF